jgi:hypothetical protein
VGALATGATAGIHASGRENSPLAELDPEALATHVTALTQEGKELEHTDGAVAGTLLGSLRYTGEELLDETYAHWITDADPAAIMTGADAGAAFAAEAANTGTPRQGAVAGTGFGLVGSYIDWDDDEFRATVDADIYKDYLEALAQEGLVDGE